jgi:hypothetical protein
MPFFPQFSNLFVPPYIPASGIIYPNQIAGLQLWLKADAGISLDGDVVTLWEDQSGNGNNANQTNDPLFVSSLINGQPAIDCVTNSGYFDLDSNIDPIKTIICVYKTDTNPSSYQAIVESNFGMYSSINFGKFGTYLNKEIGYADLSEQTAYILTIESSGGISSSGYVNGKSYEPSDTGEGFVSRDYVRIGMGQTSQPCKGYISEVIIYDSVLTTEQRQGVEAYLVQKYGIIPSDGLALWLKSDTGVTVDGSSVTEWLDQSGNGNDATASGSESPSYNATGINGLPSIDFNGEDQMVTIASSSSLNITASSVFMVMKRDGDGVSNDVILMKNGDTAYDDGAFGIVLFSSATNWAFGINEGGGWSDYNTSFDVSNNNPHIIGFRVNNLYSYPHQDNQVGSDFGGKIITITDGTLQIGGYNASFGASEYFYGKIAEVIIYNRFVSDLEKQSIMLYLNAKYSVY